VSTGPVVRYGPKRYSFNSPEAIKTIYGHSTQFAKSSFYDAFMVPGVWNLFTERNIKFHASLRREFQATYSMSNLVNFEPYVDQCARLFDQRLHEVSAAGVTIDIGHWMQCYALDVISQITFAERLGTLDSGNDIGGVMKSLEDSFYYGSTVGIYGYIHPYLFAAISFLDRLTVHGNGQGFWYVLKLAQEKINAYKAKPAAIYEKSDDGSEEFVSKFMKQNAANPERFTTDHILTGCSMNIGAGSDTTGISLSAVLYYLLKNPGCMDKLRGEITAFGKDGKLSESPTYKQSQDMPYLQAVLKEALRLHPAVGQPLERIVPEGGATVDGKYFAQGVSNIGSSLTSSFSDINSTDHRRRQLLGGPPK
jgi:cytochrome P450